MAGIREPIKETARSFHMALSPSASGIKETSICVR